jgi:uncharacterized spore protein YtfJ
VAWWAASGIAQPLAKPLADFDKLVSQLKVSSVVGEPIRAGDTEVVPFAAVQFGLGSAGAMAGFVGGVGAKTVPLGVVIVEGDDVRVELLPRQEEKSSALMQQLIQGIIDRKVTFMVNGVNLGNAPGNVADLTPMITRMMGQTTVMVNGLNLGNLKTPGPAADVDKAMADMEAGVRKNPTAENYLSLGEAWRKIGRKDKAAAAYRKAIELRPGYAEAIRALAGLKE